MGHFPPHVPHFSFPSRCVDAPKPLFVFKIPHFPPRFCPLFSPTPPCLLSTSTTFEKKQWTFFKKQGRISEKQWTFSTEVVHRPPPRYNRHTKAVQAERKVPHRHKKNRRSHTNKHVRSPKRLGFCRPMRRLGARHRGGAVGRHEPQPRIMVRSILKRTLALSAWGTPAGIMSISPAATR